MQIGLTGGIGSGKSTVAACWAALGATIIDTDALARQLSAAGGAAIPELVRVFGPEVIDAQGALDRARMRELAFGDPEVKRRLEGILHPMISAETQRLAAASQAEFIVFDVPLLVESGRWRQRVERVLVVDCSEALQRERVRQRSGWDEAAIDQVIAQQASRAQRRAAADAVIVNEGLSLEALEAEVSALAEQWRGRSSVR